LKNLNNLCLSKDKTRNEKRHQTTFIVLTDVGARPLIPGESSTNTPNSTTLVIMAG